MARRAEVGSSVLLRRSALQSVAGATCAHQSGRGIHHPEPGAEHAELRDHAAEDVIADGFEARILREAIQQIEDDIEVAPAQRLAGLQARELGFEQGDATLRVREGLSGSSRRARRVGCVPHGPIRAAG